MNPLAKQAVPGTIGGALGIIWMVYGDWLGMVPPDLSQTKELALTAAVGIMGTTLANLVRAVLPKPKETPDA